jgi:predicted ATPase/DNA-binding winged helix-turn-helix (wHTH) protein
MTGPATQTPEVLSFGPFTLIAGERLLTKDGVAVPLGARAFDILVALVSRPNQPVGKTELMAEVWPDVIVGEGSLRFHVSSLRKALGDGEGSARYISTLAGRGYCFVGPLAREGTTEFTPELGASLSHRTNVPSPQPHIVGRAADVTAISARLAATRFVTVVGTGGVGKTTVAVQVANDLIGTFAGAVLFLDLGTLSDPSLMASSLASMLGLSIQSADPAMSLIAHLRETRTLLVLDTCEHMIEATAALAARLFAAAPHVYILATSREPLRVQGEHVHRLAPLACAPDDTRLTAVQALAYPATQLFVERAAARGARLDLSDVDAAVVAGICRKLDGVPLAIELAAGRVAAFGVKQTAALLEERLSLLWVGQRTAPRRQQTLKATLDWSCRLLTELERQVLRQLAVFVGDFTLEATLAVVTSVGADPGLVLGAVDSLVAKSMVATRPVGAMMRYRLLDTTRAHALDTAVDDAGLASRHATYYREWLEQSGTQWPTLSNAAERAPYLDGLGNVRAALEWCFGAEGDARIGVALAAAAAPVVLAMSLLPECHHWSERAILALDDTTRGGVEEMQLQTAFGMSLMFTRGNSEEARVALARSLAIAGERGDTVNKLQLLGRLHLFHHRQGDFGIALRYAEDGAAVAAVLADSASRALAHCLLGISLSCVGDFSRARSELEAALELRPEGVRIGTILHGLDHFSFSSAYLAKVLWIQGYPEQALKRARRTVEEVAGMDHPVTLSVALSWAVSVFLGTGDLDAAERHTDWLIAHGNSHSLRPSVASGHGFKGELAIRRGDASGGVEVLRRSLEELRAAQYELLTTEFSIPLAQGVMATGHVPEAMSVIDGAIALVEAKGNFSHISELLRVKGSILFSMPQPDEDGAERCLMQSLDWSRRQGALTWELRAATDLASFLTRKGQSLKARTTLQQVVDQFVEGHDTGDLKAARLLLATLG